jgi:O-antigen ligase
MYCGVALPWLLSYVFTERRRLTLYLALVMYLVALLVLSWSRTAYVITLIQLLLFMGAVVFQGDRGPARRRVVALIAGGSIALVAGTIALRDTLASEFSITDVFTSLTSSNNISNLARIGSQLTAFRIGAENPAFGVGLGEYGFYMRSHVPIWAQASSEIQKWMSIEEGTRWPPVHSLYARLAAETGLPGLALWISLWLVLLAGCYRTYRRRSRALGRQDVLGLALMVSIVGVMLSQLNIDSFRIFGYWLTIGLGWAYTAQHREAPAGKPREL